jgi:MFS family permease
MKHRVLLHDRNFLLLWSGQFVSWIGTEVTGITLPLVVLALTGSPAQAGAIAAMRGIVYAVLALPAGAIIDRWDRRTVMVIANLGSGLAMGSIGVALLLHRLAIPSLYFAGAVEGSCFVFANLARFAALPRVVSKEHFPNAIANMNVAEGTAQLTGPLLGGLLYQTVGAAFSFLTDACSYVVNACSIFFITTKLQEEKKKVAASLREDIREGLVWWWSQPTLRILNLLTAGRTVIASGLYLLVIVLAKQQHASSVLIGTIFALGALGVIGGSLFASQFHHHFGFLVSLQATTILTWCIFTCYAFAFNTVVLTVITVAFFLVSPLYDVTTSTYTASHIPDSIRGRIISVSRLIVLSSFSLGYAAAGFLLQFCGTFWTVGLFSSVLLVVALTALFHPALRSA